MSPDVGWTRSVRAHLMTGVSFVIPFVTIAGVSLALGYTLGDSSTIGGNLGTLPWYLVTVGQLGLHAIIPILGAYIAYSIADRPGLAPGFVLSALVSDPRLVQATGSYVGVDTGGANAGYVGALVVGLVAGAAVRWLKGASVPAAVEPLMPVLVIPVTGTLALAPVVLLLGVPIAQGTTILTAFIRSAGTIELFLVGAVLGGLMAVDMGGPVNKVAYVFAIGLLPAFLLTPMAAVMVGGMVPPLGLACSDILTPGASVDERTRGAFVAGVAFVTEGAMRYTATDRRLTWVCVAGSAIGGGVAMGEHATMPAPHGGVFVIPLSSRPYLFVAALAAGVAVTAVGSTAVRANVLYRHALK